MHTLVLVSQKVPEISSQHGLLNVRVARLTQRPHLTPSNLHGSRLARQMFAHKYTSTRKAKVNKVVPQHRGRHKGRGDITSDPLEVAGTQPDSRLAPRRSCSSMSSLSPASEARSLSDTSRTTPSGVATCARNGTRAHYVELSAYPAKLLNRRALFGRTLLAT